MNSKIKQETVEAKPKILTAFWSFESMNELNSIYGIPYKDKSLKSTIRGKTKTVKQRNKKMTSFFIGKKNIEILKNRYRIKTTNEIIEIASQEIKNDIDSEILKSLMGL